ncbi:MAG: tetratricopeptide repeat protein [Thermoguttaceae bacterium]|jgi:tetratricopeptide (TPR) repeat protein|nr:tetratricopeptide repeat protein [Thermoguttaceae bacterium]
MKTLNFRLLAILLVSGVVLGGAVYLLHRYQVRRNADVFLHEARRALQEAEAIEDVEGAEADRKKDRLQHAVRNYVWFVRLRPNDVDALEELGGLQMDVLQYPQALGTLERVVRLDPSRSDARRKLVDITMAFGRFEDAKTHLQQFLLKEDPDNAELLELVGVCQLMDGDNKEAVKTLEAAIERNPAQLQAYRYLAIALRFRLNVEQQADEWIRRMIQANPGSLDARLLAANYFQTVGAYDEAAEHAGRALKVDPDSRDGLWLMAQCELGRENLESAGRYAAEGLQKHPEHVPMYAIAADVALRGGSREEAARWLQQGLGATRRDPQLVWYLGNLLADGGQLDEAAKLLAELKETDFTPARITYLEGRLDFQKRLWQSAARKFEKIRSDLAPWPNLVKQADYWRGRSYQQLGDEKRAEAAYRSSLNIDRSFSPSRAALADLMAAGGELEEAVGEFGRLLRAGETTPAGLAHFVRLNILRTLQAPADERNWTPVERSLADLEKADPGSLDAIRLRAEMLLAQERSAEAEKLLDDAMAERADEIGLWLIRAGIGMRQQNWDDVESVLKEAQTRFGDTLLLRLSRARYLVSRYGRNASDRLGQLAEDTDQFTDQQRQQLLLGLMGAAQQTGNWKLFKQWATEVVQKQPDNLGIRVALFEQAMRDNDREEMRRQLAAIKNIQGEGAQWLYGQAVLLSLGAEDGADKRLEQALELLNRAGKLQPRWPRVPLLTAGIYERQGRDEDALESYRNAVDMGETNPNAFRRFIQLLTKRGLFDEAQQRMEQLDQLGAQLPSELSRLRGGLLVNVGQLDEALDQARQTAANSESHADHLWLGRLAAGKGQRETSLGNEEAGRQLLHEAEESFLRAAAMGGDAPDTHLALIQLYMATSRRELAATQIEQIEKHVDQQRRPLALAAAYELLGEAAQAEKQYQAALEAEPSSALRARLLAEFYWRTNRPERAEQLASRILETDEFNVNEDDRRWARRQLARVLIARGGYQNLIDAGSLIDENLKHGENEADRRIKVALDQAHPSRAKRERAIKDLEQLVAKQSEKVPSDVLGLAQLYLAADNWPKARPLLRDLATSHPEELRYVATFVEALLNHGEAEEAEPHLEQLAATAPNNFGTVSLQAESLFLGEQYEQVLDLLNEFVDRPDAQPEDASARLRLVAGAFERFIGRLREAEQNEHARQFTSAAESLYRRYLQIHPEHELLLAAFLARQGRTVEAMGMFERRWQTLNSANLAQMAAILLKSDAVTKDQIQRTERIVERAIQEASDPVPLHLVMAEIRTEQQRFDDAEEHYRDILKKHPDHAVALNNLAVLLALQGIKLDEAEEFINRAIAGTGPVGSMLDSRATVYTARGEYDKALSDINQAIAENDSPAWLFRRALIHFRAGRKAEATKALAEAHMKGLTAEMLQPLERSEYQKIQTALK